jgi:lycopene cyclase domain-containing protein
MREYTVIAAAAVLGVVALELLVLHTGLLRTRAYWIAMAICYGFMIAVNGWLTKLSAPIVIYNRHETTGWRFPWDIPVEDYLFGFALLTLSMLLWDRATAREGREPREAREPVRPREPAR